MPRRRFHNFFRLDFFLLVCGHTTDDFGSKNINMNIEHHITNMEQWKLAFNMTVLVIALPFSPRAISKAILLLHILQLILPIEAALEYDHLLTVDLRTQFRLNDRIHVEKFWLPIL